MMSFLYKYKKDHSYKAKVGEMVEAYVRNDGLLQAILGEKF
jgi:hypothetical protein